MLCTWRGHTMIGTTLLAGATLCTCATPRGAESGRAQRLGRMDPRATTNVEWPLAATKVKRPVPTPL